MGFPVPVMEMCVVFGAAAGGHTIYEESQIIVRTVYSSSFLRAMGCNPTEAFHWHARAFDRVLLLVPGSRCPGKADCPIPIAFWKASCPKAQRRVVHRG